MSYCRFQYQDVTRYGLIEERRRSADHHPHADQSPQAFADFDAGERSELPLSAVRLLAPVEPSKIVCIGRNYREHAKELNHPIPTEPLFFLKPPSSLIGPEDEIRRPVDAFAASGLRRRVGRGDRPDAAIACAKATTCGPTSWATPA